MQSSSKIGFFFVLAMIGLLGCDEGWNRQSGGDEMRPQAIAVPLGIVITDQLSPRYGDHTDWKSFAVPADGVLAIRIYWDNSKEIKDAVITVHDKYGIQLAEREHDPDVPIDELLIRVHQGYYYMKIEAQKGESIYSVQAEHLLTTPSHGEAPSTVPMMVAPLELEVLKQPESTGEEGTDEGAAGSAAAAEASLEGLDVGSEGLSFENVDALGMEDIAPSDTVITAELPEEKASPAPEAEPEPSTPSLGAGEGPDFSGGGAEGPGPEMGDLGEGPGLEDVEPSTNAGENPEARSEKNAAPSEEDGMTQVIETEKKSKGTGKVVARILLISPQDDKTSLIKLDKGSVHKFQEGAKCTVEVGGKTYSCKIKQISDTKSWAVVKAPQEALSGATQAVIETAQ